MLVPLSWLKDFTPLNIDPLEVATTLTDLGLVVEGVEHIGGNLDGVVVGNVVDVRAHPNADKVRLSDIDLGDGNPIQIACGAANLAIGQKVAVATIGTVLPGDFKIERRKLRGEWSNGMICSATELGITKQPTDGIMVLPDDVSVGTPFTEAMGIVPDVVFDLAIETNRPDAMCITGIARDIAGKLNLPFSIPEPVFTESDVPASTLATAVVERPELCPRFTVRVLTDVKVGPSPELISRRLTLAGMRPINNIVDASNYVMLELGQPTHPYNLAQLPGRGLRVRAAKEGETLLTLDNVERKLNERDCVVCDAQDNIVGLAGVMGGASSEISADTTEVLVEAAVWDPYVVNHMSRRLALRTDASARYERKVDIEGVIRSQNRICQLILESSPTAKVANGIIDVAAPNAGPIQVHVRTARVNSVLGTSLTDEQIRNYLTPIGFEVAPLEAGLQETGQNVTIPTFRPDSDREIDVIEEIARMHGYSNIERRVPKSPHSGGLSIIQQRRRQLRALLTGKGLTEAWSATLLSHEDFEKSGLSSSEAIELSNPIVAEESKLRTSMLPGMLRAVSFNVTRRHVGVRLFDIGNVFNESQDQTQSQTQDSFLPKETEHLAVVVAGDGDDALTAASLWRDIATAFRVEGIEVENNPTAGSHSAPGLHPVTGLYPTPGLHPMSGLHPTRSAELRTAEGVRIGVLGEVDPKVLENYAIDRRVGWIEVDISELFACIGSTPQMLEVSRFPAAEFDLAFLVPHNVQASEIDRTLREATGEFLERIRLFDVFRGDQAGVGRRSLAYRMTIAALDHTLTDAEVAEVRSRCISAVEATHGADLRA